MGDTGGKTRERIIARVKYMSRKVTKGLTTVANGFGPRQKRELISIREGREEPYRYRCEGMNGGWEKLSLSSG